MISRTPFALLGLALAAFAIRAAPAAAAPATAPTDVTTLTVHPAAVPWPLMRERLLPSAEDQVPGNAALFYDDAALLSVNGDTGKTATAEDALDNYLATPFAAAGKTDMNAFVANYKNTLHLIDLAALRDDCNFDLPIREDSNAALMPYLNSVRNLAEIVAVEVRRQAAAGRYDDAIHSLQSDFAFAHHLTRRAILVQGIVAGGMTMLATRRLGDIEEAPGSPNLYWALTDLPRPFIPLQSIEQNEGLVLAATVPMLAYPIAYPPDPRWNDALDRIIATLRGESTPVPPTALLPGLTALSFYPRSRAYLLSHNFTSDQIHNMPAETIVAMALVADLREQSDQAFAAVCLPYPEGFAAAAAADARRAELLSNSLPNPLIAFLPNSTGRAVAAAARVDRGIAIRRCIEAIRAYAASHNARPPAHLADASDTPAPPDPATNAPFGYSSSGQTAVIEAPEIRGGDGTVLVHAERFEITVAP